MVEKSLRSCPSAAFCSSSVVAPLLVVIAAGASTPTEPAGRGSAPHPIPRVDARIDVDGVLDEAVWQQAWSTTLDYEVRPGENTPAPIRTEVLVMYDANRLYVGFRAYDPDLAAIRAHLSDRDQAWNDDWVGVVLDTFNDERRDYLFVVNPLGVQMDQIETESTGQTPWDGIWKSAAAFTEWGWSVEIEIPFSTLRFQRSDEPQIWGFDAIRGYPRNVSAQMGTFPRDRSNNCYLCQALKIEGFAGVSPGRNLEIVPTLTGVAHRPTRRPPGRTDGGRRPGGGIRSHRPLGIHSQHDCQRHPQPRLLPGGSRRPRACGQPPVRHLLP